MEITNFLLTAILLVILTRPAWRRNPLLTGVHDDSDPAGGGFSHLIILTDHRTGLEYLSTAWGGLTPRLDRGGVHIGSSDEASAVFDDR